MSCTNAELRERLRSIGGTVPKRLPFLGGASARQQEKARQHERAALLEALRTLPGIQPMAKGSLEVSSLEVSSPQVAACSMGKSKASCTIRLPLGVSAADFQATIADVSEVLQQELVTKVTSVPGIATVLRGALTILDMRSEVVTAPN